MEGTNLQLSITIFVSIFGIINGASIHSHHEEVSIKLKESSIIIGKRVISREGRDYLAFLGVPYAKPPLGQLRFEPPIPIPLWNGTLNATVMKPDCLQKDKYNPIVVTKGSEDCLYLNIYTPKIPESSNNETLLPVLFYVHGGGPYGSGSRYGGEYLMDEDVVLITVNYRLGVLGNLNTNDSLARGNQGLKDHVMGLRWVQQNIVHFGGNPNKVTIFGNSYGSMAISAHLMSPMSKGLFHRAICQSFEQIAPSILSQDPLSTAKTLAQKLNCTGNSTADIFYCFRQMDGDTLVLSSHDMMFTTSVEPMGSPSDTILPDSPLNLLRSGQLNSVPVMIGATSGEGLGYSLPILISPNLTAYFNNHWEIAAVEALALKSVPGLKDPERIANAAREFYIGAANISRAIETNLTALMSDRTFIHPAALTADLHWEHRKQVNLTTDQIYLYYFNKQSDKSYADPVLIEYGSEKFLGAGHSDELQYIFPYESFSYISMDSPHFNFSKMLVRLWTSFADEGIPSGAYNNVEWLPINAKPYEWFKLDKNPQMINMLGNRMNFWDSFNSTDLYV